MNYSSDLRLEKKSQSVKYLNTDENFHSSSTLTQSKKKYNLGGLNFNVSKLKKDQINEMTKFLIAMKAEYDNLIKESSQIKGKTENMGKQIALMERIDKMTNTGFNEQKEMLDSLKHQIIVKKNKVIEESYQRDTLQNLIDKMQSDLLINKKQITDLTKQNDKCTKDIEIQRFKKTSIKEKVNNVHSNMLKTMSKNFTDSREHQFLAQYYSTVIDQKNAFSFLIDDRKNKQAKVAAEAKNDTLDKEEVDKRKVYFNCLLYNKYLRLVFDKVLKENRQLEQTYLEIRDVTGISNLKVLIEKLEQKDKRYNRFVTKVNEYSKRVEELKIHNSTLYQDKVDLKNEERQEIRFIEEKRSLSTSYLFTEESTLALDNNDLELKKEEEKLEEELRELQHKNEEVVLVYDKVTQNIRNMLKAMKASEASSNARSSINQTEKATQRKEADTENQDEPTVVKEEELKEGSDIEDDNTKTEKPETDKKEEQEKTEVEATEDKNKETELEAKETKDENTANDEAKAKETIEVNEEKKEEDSQGNQITTAENNNQSTINVEDQENKKETRNDTDEILKNYIEYLTVTKKRLNEVFLDLKRAEYYNKMQAKAQENENKESEDKKRARNIIVKGKTSTSYKQQPHEAKKPAKTVKLGNFQIPEYDYALDQETMFEEEEIKLTVKKMIEEAKKENKRIQQLNITK